MEEFSDRIMNRNALGLEYDALDSGEDVSDAEFVTENLNGVPAAFRDVVNRIVLVKKARVVSAITGFTRLGRAGRRGGRKDLKPFAWKANLASRN